MQQYFYGFTTWDTDFAYILYYILARVCVMHLRFQMHCFFWKVVNL